LFRSIKWSGLYYMAFFGVLLVGLDAHRRWRYGVRRPLLGALLRDAPPHFFAVVIIPLCCYLLSWRAWFGSETSVYRHAVESGLVEDATALAESRSEERRVGKEGRGRGERWADEERRQG